MKSRLNFLAVAPLLLSTLLACNGRETNLCAAQIPALIRDMDTAIAALEPWKPVYVAGTPAAPGKTDGRKPSSVASSGTKPHWIHQDMAIQDREAWSAWAEKRLLETQRYGDTARFDRTSRGRTLKSELNAIATAVVVFHGYALRGDTKRMNEKLGVIKGMSEALAGKVCSVKE